MLTKTGKISTILVNGLTFKYDRCMRHLIFKTKMGLNCNNIIVLVDFLNNFYWMILLLYTYIKYNNFCWFYWFVFSSHKSVYRVCVIASNIYLCLYLCYAKFTHYTLAIYIYVITAARVSTFKVYILLRYILLFIYPCMLDVHRLL